MKRFSWLCLGVAFTWLVAFQLARAEAADRPADSQSVQIDFSTDVGPATCRGSGFLHSFSPIQPVAELVEPLKPKAFRMTALSLPGDTGAAFDTWPRIHKMGATLQVLFSDAFGYGGQFGIHPERKDMWPGDNGDWTLWEQCVEGLVKEAKAKGCAVHWDVWNEPDLADFWKPEGDKKARYCEMWIRAYRKAKSLDPNAVIVGPSNAYYNDRVHYASRGPFDVEEFLTFAKANNVLPDILSWHVWHEADVLPTVRQARAFMKANDINIPRISLNEIVHGDHQVDPGVQVWYFANIEEAGVESACHACWPAEDGSSSCWNATLCNLVTYPDRKPRAKWWVYKAYADITGTLVRVNGTPEVTAVAGKDTTARTAHILLGKKAGKKESLAVKMTGMQDMSYLKDDQGKVRIVVQRIPNAGWKAVEKPLAVRDEIVPLADAMEVILPDFGPSEAFVVSLSPAR